MRLLVLAGLAAVAAGGCTVKLEDPSGRACDDAHPCSGGRACIEGRCTSPAPGSNDAGETPDGGGNCSAELCDGLDNDCSGTADDHLTPPPCTLTEGVCASVNRTCDGASGWGSCDYGADYEATESRCDGLDNDCDGIVDDVSGCMYTIAGLGPPGLVDGPADVAQYAEPSYLAADAQGNVYVADWDNQAIRKVAPDGSVTTIAGGAGVCGDQDGPAARARFCNPWDVEVAPNGDVFITDTYNNKVKKLSNGVVTTVAGSGAGGYLDGPALTGQLREPGGLLLLTNGDLLIADRRNGRIRRYVAATQTLATEAGSGLGTVDGSRATVKLNYPGDVALGPGGELYVSESRSHRIRELPVSGTSTTFAGSTSGASGYADGVGVSIRFDGPEQLWVDTAAQALLVADSGNGRVRAIPLNETDPSYPLVGGAGWGYANGLGPLARFNALWGFVKVNGAFILADNNHVLRKATPNQAFAASVVEPFSGPDNPMTPTDGPAKQARLVYPYGITLTSTGAVLFTDTLPGAVRKLENGVVTTLAGGKQAGYQDGPGAQARFDHPGDVAVGSDGKIYVADTFNACIRVIDPADNVVALFAGSAGNAGFADGALGVARFSDPHRLLITTEGPQEVMFVSDRGNNLVRKIVLPSGPVSTVAGTPGVQGTADGDVGTGRMREVNGLAVDADGNLYIGDEQRIRKVPAGGGALTTAFTLPGWVYGLAADGNKLVASDYQNAWTVDLTTSVTSLILDASNGHQDGMTGNVATEGLYDLVVTQDAYLFVDNDARRLRRLWK